MKIELDQVAGALYVQLTEGEIEKSEEIKPGESWQIAETHKAITGADAGDFASDAEFNAAVKKHAG